MASLYYGSETDNSSYNGSTGRSSPQPVIAVPVSPSGDTVDATVIGTSTAADGAYPSQSDGSTVGVNPIPGQSYQPQSGHQRYSYYGQPNAYGNQTGAYINYGNMSQNNRFSRASYDSSSIGRLSGIFDASSSALGASYLASTPLTTSTISLAPPSSQPSTGLGPTMVGSSLVPIQEDESFILGAGSAARPSSPPPMSSGSDIVTSVVPAPLSPQVDSEPTIVMSPAASSPLSPPPPPKSPKSTTSVPPSKPKRKKTDDAVLPKPSRRVQEEPTEPTRSPPNNNRQGKRCCSLRPKVILPIVFCACIGIAVSHFFIWPRIPDVMLDNIRVTNPISLYPRSKTEDYGFHGEWEVSLKLNSSNYVSQTIETLDVTLYADGDTDSQIGSGGLNNLKILRGESAIDVPVDISYEVSGAKDPVLVDMEESCINGTYVDIRIHVELTMSALSLDGSTDFEVSYRCKK